jgi:hypothetical protein
MWRSRAVSFLCLCSALTWALFPTESSATTPRSPRLGSASALKAYSHAFQSLAAVKRFRFYETAQLLQGKTSSVTDDVRFLRPDRVSVTLISKPSNGQSLRLESVQVGTRKCQRPPGWVCFHSAKAAAVTLVRSLVTPKLKRPTFTEQFATLAVGSRRYRVKEIQISGTQTFHYEGTLVVRSDNGLPISFVSTVTQGKRVLARQNAQLTYNGTFTIHLPRTRKR